MGGKPTGRFSNGKTPPDMLVEDLGIKALMPAYLDPNLKVEDLKTGVSFASGASGYDPLTPILASALPLSIQLAFFQQYIWKLKGFVGEEETNNIVKTSLYIVAAGSDDLCNTYFMLKIPRKTLYNIDSYTNLMVDGASNFVKDLYNMGARRIWVFGIPPIGCLPSQRMRSGGPPRVCVDEYNQAALMTNTKLAAKMDSLSENLPESELVYINIYDPLLDLIVNHDKYVEELGIKELFPAYLDPNLQEKDLITGVNFASGGAGYDPLTSEISNVIALSCQLEMFKEYIVKLKEIVGKDRKNEILANSFFILVTGSNDITNTYFSTPLRKSYYDVSSYADFLLNYASSFLQDLYRLGARRIGVLSIPPIGCLPSQRTLKGGEQRECVNYLN
ncbi:hypothetical protein K7X08_001707 [Anisodus acutangulus]|uniref:GDSL esterase/lipase EXL3 n=1 Tax=Anisodus acutangulus TaxID=402998 RepID=A0A9Q1R6M2_9SOLA|nr:hypothetical protein K7X08_001707 [Anisodus acutangulus]